MGATLDETPGIVEEPKPAVAPVVAPIEKPKDTPKVETVEELKTIIAGLKAQLDDENNPTNKQRYLTLKGMFDKANEEIKALKEAKPVEAPLVTK
jgi:hypothetical protein